ncbi:hypothetical protein BH23CHL5_BH23CHL5_02650 [soil metagenome]
MVRTANAASVEFGRTDVAVNSGDITDQPVQAIIIQSNAKGILSASGSSALRSLAGFELERELMALAPLELGSAVQTGSGRLANRGVSRIFHATISESPGGQPTLPTTRSALTAALDLSWRSRVELIATPILGLGSALQDDQRYEWVEAIVSEVISHIRRRASQLERVVLVTKYPDDQPLVEQLVREARATAWR